MLLHPCYGKIYQGALLQKVHLCLGNLLDLDRLSRVECLPDLPEIIIVRAESFILDSFPRSSNKHTQAKNPFLCSG